MKGNIANSVDQYIASFPKDVQRLLQQMRTTISEAAPQAEETIKYAMPTFVFYGNLVHFAGYQKHIGFYPTPSGLDAFKKDLAGYKGSKGAVQFPLDKPLPLNIIAKIVRYRVKETLAGVKVTELTKKKAPSDRIRAK